MMEIDGSFGEGGGQILRTSLALSCLTGKPFTITNIRRRRSKPGLMPQHLMAVKAGQAISGATVDGAGQGSTQLRFSPGRVEGGKYNFDIGTAGAVSLVLQTLVPPLLRAHHPSTVTLIGGTHVPTSPSVTYLQQVFVPLLRQLGGKLDISVESCGFYPRGGGRVVAQIEPSNQLEALRTGSSSGVQGVNGLSAVCNLPLSIAERQRISALETLAAAGSAVDTAKVEVTEVKGIGQGTFIFLAPRQSGITAGFTALGARGKPAETVGHEAATELVRYLSTDSALDPHLADQMIIYLALAGGESSFTTSMITPHLLTNLAVVQRFLPIDYQASGVEGHPGIVRLARR